MKYRILQNIKKYNQLIKYIKRTILESEIFKKMQYILSTCKKTQEKGKANAFNKTFCSTNGVAII